MERFQLHPSGLSLHTDCGEAWRRVFIENERSEPNEYLVVGTALDAAVSADLNSKLSFQSLLPEDVMVEIAADRVRRSTLDPNLKQLCLDRATGLARYAHRKFCPPIQVKSIQRPWSVRLDAMLRRRGLRGMKIDYVGTLDVEENLYDFTHLTAPAGTGVLDLKSSRISPPKDAANKKHWIQMSSYVLGMFVLDGVQPKQVKISTLVSADGKIVTQKDSVGERDDNDFAALFNRLEQFARSYKSGIFLPASPAHWKCSKDWCVFHPTCAYVRNPVTVSLSVPKLLQIKSCTVGSSGRSLTGIKLLSPRRTNECQKLSKDK